MLLNIIFAWICTFCHWMWLLPLLLLLSWLLGYFFGRDGRNKLLDRIDSLEREITALKNRITEGDTEITNLKYELEKSTNNYNTTRSKKADLELKLRACSEQRTALEAQLLALQDNVEDTNDGGDSAEDDSLGIYDGNGAGDDTYSSGSTGIGALFTNDNLQIIEGVGPKIEGLLKAAGYGTWSDVGDAEIEALQKVLEDAGPRYRVHSPKTWPEQARLAANGDWDALIKYQQFLDTGRDDTASTGMTPSKVEKLYAKKIGFAAFKPNDLKIIEGIGPKIAGLLNDAGINTWAELAACPVARIQEVLTAAGDRYRLADPSTWPKQAALAADAKWAALKAYQDALDGGRE